MSRLYPALAILALSALLLLAACDDGDGGPAMTDTAAVTTGTPAPAPADSFEGGREPVEKPGGTAPPMPVLVDVQAASHDGFDRVVFEFTGALPGYRVEYVSAPIVQCESGEQVTVSLLTYLQVRMTPAAAHDEAGAPTFGSQLLIPGLPSVVEVGQICDFEAELTWVLGLYGNVDFAVSDLTDPFRIVVDVAQP